MPISNYDKTRPLQLGISAFNLLSLAEGLALHRDNKRCLSILNNDRIYTKPPCTLIRKILKTEIFLSVLKKKKDTGPKPSTGCSVFEAFSTLKRWKNDSVLYRAMLVIYELARNN